MGERGCIIINAARMTSRDLTASGFAIARSVTSVRSAIGLSDVFSVKCAQNAKVVIFFGIALTHGIASCLPAFAINSTISAISSLENGSMKER